MKLVILAVGKAHDALFKDAIDVFTSRVDRYVSSEWKFVNASKREGDVQKKEEGDAILKTLEDNDFVVLLDERGKSLSSVDFSQFFERQMISGVKRIVFIIGGAFGVSPEVIKRANSTISLSRMVFPHQLVRLILVEQLYRGISIIKGEKYHHE
jgi:23S rRNA (pseudouridine1915-N3)-methyltransferase